MAVARPHKHEWEYIPSDDERHCIVKNCGAVEYGVSTLLTKPPRFATGGIIPPRSSVYATPEFGLIASIDAAAETMSFITRGGPGAGAVSLTFEELERSIKGYGPWVIEPHHASRIKTLIDDARRSYPGVTHAGYTGPTVVGYTNPVFGELVSVNREEASAVFERKGGDRTEISGEMVVGLADALGKAGAISAEAATAMTEAFMRINELNAAIWDATESSIPVTDTTGKIEEVIAFVRDTPDPELRRQLVSQYITQLTNGLYELIREED